MFILRTPRSPPLPRVRSSHTSLGFVIKKKKNVRPRAGPQLDPPRARPRTSAHTTRTAWLCPVHSVESYRNHSFHATQVWRKPRLERRDLGAAPPPAGSISAQYAENNAYLASAVVKASNAVRAVKSALCSPSSESSIMPGLPTGKPGPQQRPVTPRSTCQVCPLAWVTDIEPTTSSPLDRT